MILLADLSEEHLSLLVGGVLGMLVLSSSLVVFFIVYQRRIFAQQRAREVEAQLHQQQLLAAAVEAQENERRRIARDLHDEIGSLLTATRLYLRQLAPGGEDQRILNIREQSLTIVDEMIQSTRRISHDLLPPTLEKFGFQAAAEDLCERINQTDTVNVKFHGFTEERMEPKRELALYRVLQELINNTLKHAAANNIDVTFKRRRSDYSFIYKDDGRGYDATRNGHRGLGLRNIESRVTLVSAKLDSTSCPDKGLKVTVDLPTR